MKRKQDNSILLLFRNTYISHREKTDEQLMKLVCRGDRAAFEILYDRYFNKLVWFAQRFIPELQQAEDTVQEVFMKIIEKPQQFDSERKFSSWVYMVTGNACKNMIRDRDNRLRILHETQSAADISMEPHHQHDYELLQEKIKTAYRELSEKEKNIFVLRFEQELSIREIAEIIDIPEGSVKSGMYYLLKKISTHLKDFNHGK
jgi:RNA polymerase sigma-70 factor (ECF subfamily)